MRQHTPGDVLTSHRGERILFLGTLSSRILGFMRDMLLAHLLGAAADIFLVAFRLPNFFRRMLAEGSLGMAVTAAVTRSTAILGAAVAAELSRDLLILLLAISFPATLLLAFAALPITFVMAPGLSHLPGSLDRAALLFQYCLPYLPLSTFAAVAIATKIARGSFFSQAFSPVAFNICVLTAGGIASLCAFGLARTELALCTGICIAGIVQLLLALYAPDLPGRTQPYGVRVYNPCFLLRRALHNKDAQRVLRTLPAAVFGASAYQLYILVGVFIASFMQTGSISALYFSERLIELPLGLAGVAIGIATGPHLATAAANHNIPAFTAALSRGVTASLFLSLPAAAGLAGLATPLTVLFFGHGAYSPEETTVTAACLLAYAPGLPALCALRPLLAALSALGNTRAPTLAAIAGLAMTLLVSLLLLPLGPAGIALGVSCASILSAGILLHALHRQGIPSPFSGAVPRILTYCFLSALLYAALRYLPMPLDERLLLAGLICLLAAGLAFLWCFFFWALGNKDAHSFTSRLRNVREEEH